MRGPQGCASRIRLRVVLLATGILVAWGCASRANFTPARIPQVQELLQRLQTEDARLQTLQALGNLKWSRDGEKFSMDHALLLRRPGTLRLEGLSPLGSAILSFSIQKGEAELFVPGESRALRGPASDQVMERLFSLPMRVEEVIGILCGRPPLCSPGSAQVRAEGGFWILELDCQDSGRHEQIRLDPAQGDPVSMVILSASGEVMATVSWSGFRKVGDVRIPMEIRAELPTKGSRLVLRLKEVDPNLPIPDERFRLNIPSHIRVEPLS